MDNKVKQVIVLRKDLNMRKGKMVAQGAHASLAVFFDRMAKLYNGGVMIDKEDLTKPMREWMDGPFTKICVSVDSEAELMEVYQKAKDTNIPCSLIKDAGLTEFKEPTYTAVAIGPDTSDRIDPITGALKLL